MTKTQLLKSIAAYFDELNAGLQHQSRAIWNYPLRGRKFIHITMQVKSEQELYPVTKRNITIRRKVG